MQTPCFRSDPGCAYAGAQVFHMDPGNQPRLEAPLCLKLQTRATIYRAGNPFPPPSSKLGGRMIGALYSLAADGVNRIECAYASKGKQIEPNEVCALPSTRMWPWPPPRPLYSCHPSACLQCLPAILLYYWHLANALSAYSMNTIALRLIACLPWLPS